jgi:hypothetical protein
MLLTSYGCMSSTPPEPKVEHPAVQTYKSFVKLSVNTLEKALKVIDEYTMMSKDPHFKSMASSGSVDIRDLVSYLNSRGGERLLALRRMKVMEDGSQAEVSLGEELSNIIKEFQEEIEKIAPDPTPALSLPGVKTNEEGNIVIGDDMIIDRKTLPGAITTEVLNAQARGEDVEEVLRSLSDAGEEVCEELGASNVGENETNSTDMRNTLSPKYLYRFSTPRWPKGQIPYRFCYNVPLALREAVSNGMIEWEKASGGKVKFVYAPPGIEDIFVAMGIGYKLVVMIDDNLSVPGRATVGCWWSYMWLNPKMVIRTNIDYYSTTNITNVYADMSVILHELGHVLGLDHEHQREDRDEYVDLKIIDLSMKSQYEKIPFSTWSYIEEVQKSIVTRTIRIKVLWWTIEIPIVDIIFNVVKKIVKNTPISTASKEYDYFSIMHYSSSSNYAIIKSKRTVTNIWTNWDGVVITNTITNGQPIPYNTSISRLDAEGVKELYK